MVGWNRKITIDNKAITNGAGLTLKHYGLLDVLNSHFQKELNIKASMASGLSAAYFGAYFLCPLTISGWILRRFGFRITFMTGLVVLAVGCLLFWPSGVKRSFGGFCGSMFVVGAGLSTLGTGADNFLAICGPPRYFEIRLNLAQGVQGAGTFVAPLLASRVFFAKTIDTANGLKNVQWVYLGVACFIAVLIILFWLAPMPEVTDSDMHVIENNISENEDARPLKKQTNLFLGVWSQFCYVGAQVAVANYFIDFCEESGYDAAASSNLLAVAQGVYTFNRFLAARLMTIPAIKLRFILGIYLFGAIVFCLTSTLSEGSASVAYLILVLWCFESACFVTIYTLALRGLGRRTKLGGSMLVAAISGGAAIPPMAGAVAPNNGSFHRAMGIPTGFFVLAWIYPVYANFVNAKKLDEHRVTDLNIEPTHRIDKALEIERASSVTEEDKAVGQPVQIDELE